MGPLSVVLNRPEKKNALTPAMYKEIQAGLEEAAGETETVMTVVSAKGDYYSSGNDLGNFMVDMSDIARVAKESNDLLRFQRPSSRLGKGRKEGAHRNFVGALIDHPKPLIGLVHGPAIGICVTTLALFDVVYASDRATIHAPFSHLGQSPEGCSAFLFPRIMGPAKASEFLLFGRKLTAGEAEAAGLVSRVFPDQDFGAETERLLQAYARLPPQVRPSPLATSELRQGVAEHAAVQEPDPGHVPEGAPCREQGGVRPVGGALAERRARQRHRRLLRCQGQVIRPALAYHAA